MLHFVYFALCIFTFVRILHFMFVINANYDKKSKQTFS